MHRQSFIVALFAFIALGSPAVAAEAKASGVRPAVQMFSAVSKIQGLFERDVPGGLCVIVGSGDGTTPMCLAATGRYLVHDLESDPAAVERLEAEAKQTAVRWPK